MFTQKIRLIANAANVKLTKPLQTLGLILRFREKKTKIVVKFLS